jgi:outer membrane lipoprotein carrier protein
MLVANHSPEPQARNVPVIARSLALLLMIPLAATAAGPARDRLDTFARGLAGLEGRFTQVVHDANGILQEQSQGTVALRAPRQFRWEYQAPYPQLIVADGSNVWVHDLDLEQVTVRSQSAEESQSPLTVLTDLALLERRLEPRATEAPFERCDLGFDATQGLVSMRLHDSLGQRNEIRFADWARNPQFAADAFTFTVPEGADLIGEPVVAAQAFPIRD